ncbi:MAG: ROK family transcriptional regulator [Eubacteriales bacterium]|nr:ROK family transcriptional regulator [Eubacteriales bacterium]
MAYITEPTHQMVIKMNNKSRILTELWKNSPISRSNLAKLTGLNKATITNLVKELDEEGYIAEVGRQSSRVGRASDLIMFNDEIGMCCGVAISTYNIRVILCDAYARTLWRSDWAFERSGQPQTIMERIASEIKKGIDEIDGSKKRKLRGIGIGLPSLVERESGVMYGTPNIVNWSNIPVKDFFARRFQVPVFLDTISNNAVIGEKWFGAAQNDDNVIYLSIGQGIGAGILTNGRLYSGAGGYAGDISHMVIDPSGPVCPCGKRGCWEVMGTTYTLMPQTIDELTEKADMRDIHAIEVLGSIGRSIGIGVANLVRVLNPSLVLIGGSMARAGKWIMNPCVNQMKTELWTYVFDGMNVRFSELGDDSGVIGSATRVIEAMLVFQA